MSTIKKAVKTKLKGVFALRIVILPIHEVVQCAFCGNISTIKKAVKTNVNGVFCQNNGIFTFNYGYFMKIT